MNDRRRKAEAGAKKPCRRVSPGIKRIKYLEGNGSNGKLLSEPAERLANITAQAREL